MTGNLASLTSALPLSASLSVCATGTHQESLEADLVGAGGVELPPEGTEVRGAAESDREG